MLRVLAEKPAVANTVLPMKVFVQALRSGVLRLREAQMTFAGSDTRSSFKNQGLGQIDEDEMLGLDEL